jgi:GNAT superfamily N-acetyltransferase
VDGPTHVDIVATDELTADQRGAVVEVCVAANRSEEFRRLFTDYILSGGRHALGYLGPTLVSHAVVTTRWAQPAGSPVLRTAFFDAVATHPDVQGVGHGSAVVTALAGRQNSGDDVRNRA